MNNRMSSKRIEELATGTDWTLSNEEFTSLVSELLERRQAEKEPIYWEIAGQLFSSKEEALKPGFIGTPEPLYEAPVLAQSINTELLEALQLALESGVLSTHHATKARAAIAKALGESK